jgi:redox-sensitive bicupin YhaK (pirin superfamily)
MLKIIRSTDRYHMKNDWLSTRWHFSFDQYYDPENVSFGPLRVFNDDVVAPGSGFPMHPHKEMEIVTYVIEGAVEHKDSMGNVGRITPGEIQRMSAGTGIRHSEYNPSKGEPTRLVQLWIIPAEPHLPPSWEQKKYSQEARSGKLLPIAVPVDTTDAEVRGAVRIHQDATIYTSILSKGDSVQHKMEPGRRAYLFVVDGDLMLQSKNGKGSEPAVKLQGGDQARITDVSSFELAGGADPAEILLLDLP